MQDPSTAYFLVKLTYSLFMLYFLVFRTYLHKSEVRKCLQMKFSLCVNWTIFHCLTWLSQLNMRCCKSYVSINTDPTTFTLVSIGNFLRVQWIIRIKMLLLGVHSLFALFWFCNLINKTLLFTRPRWRAWTWSGRTSARTPSLRATGQQPSSRTRRTRPRTP